MLRSTHRVTLFVALMLVGTAGPLFAQGAEADLAGCKNSRLEHLAGVRVPVTTAEGVVEMRYVLTGSPERPVRIDCDETSLSGDRMDLVDGHKVIATGNVLFESPTSRIVADRLEFDTKSRTGTFYGAAGQVSVANRVDRSLFGTQEPDAYFRGEEIHKLGPDTYKIVRGAFTTCVQPTPRWEMVAGAVTLKVDDHALLRNAVLRVKGVPVMYLPVFYYPVQEDDRASGFLLPVYGTSTIRGQSLSNAFFWAINRSQDATFMHDWFSKTGQGYGSEYRYVRDGGNRGDAAFNFLNEHAATYNQDDGSVTTTNASRSYTMRGGLTQKLGFGLHARANVDYSSNLAVQQRYQQDVLQINNRSRIISGNVTGNWKEYVLNATLNKNDIFYGEDSLTTTGGLPRVSLSRGERPIAGSKVYFGVNGEYATQIYKTEVQGRTTDDRGLTRLDVNPVVRIPFTKWPFLTVNSSVGWRATYWTESLNAEGVQVAEGVSRRLFDFSARVTGPVFNRIFNTPGGSYAEKYKHVIEPSFTIQRTTAVDVFNRIVRNEGSDQIPGNVTRLTYALNNRLYAKKTTSREIIGLSLSQTYYSDSTASQYDPQYNSSYSTTAKPSSFSPVRIQARVSPNTRVQGDLSTEFNTTANAFTIFNAGGTLNSERLQVSAGWSRRRYIAELPEFSNQALANHDLNASATIRSPANHLGGSYQFNFDLQNTNMRQQRVIAFYNAQCCGVSVEYQAYNLGGFSRFVVPQDRRFNVSFTLAGIGTFSNFFGAFGGQQNR